MLTLLLLLLLLLPRHGPADAGRHVALVTSPLARHGSRGRQRPPCSFLPALLPPIRAGRGRCLLSDGIRAACPARSRAGAQGAACMRGA